MSARGINTALAWVVVTVFVGGLAGLVMWGPTWPQRVLAAVLQGAPP